MLPLQVKTYRTGLSVPDYHFYVLCKGLNSGKPLTAPCPNCFIVTTGSREDRETLYWITYALWMGRAFHMLLRGSVIPFITIHDFRTTLTTAIRIVKQSRPGFDNVIKALRQLEEKEAQAWQQLQTIGQLKQLVARKLME